MPSRAIETPLRDILHHIDLAAQLLAGFDYAMFNNDVRTVYDGGVRRFQPDDQLLAFLNTL
jgi:hypothetical protein